MMGMMIFLARILILETASLMKKLTSTVGREKWNWKLIGGRYFFTSFWYKIECLGNKHKKNIISKNKMPIPQASTALIFHRFI